MEKLQEIQEKEIHLTSVKNVYPKRKTGEARKAKEAREAGKIKKSEPKKAETLQSSENAAEIVEQENQMTVIPLFSQFELSKALYASGFLARANLTPTSKLVIIALVGHYNPSNKDMFPSQKYLANQLGISEKSIERGIKELVKEKYIFYKTEKVNHYQFTTKFFNSVKMTDTHRQIDESEDRQNDGQTKKEEKIKNNEFFNKNFSDATSETTQRESLYSKSKYKSQAGKTYQKYAADKNSDTTKDEKTCGRALPTVSETKEYLEKFAKDKENSCSPLDFTRKQAEEWLNTLGIDDLHLRFFAVSLRKKFNLKLPKEVRARLLDSGKIKEDYEK